MIRKKINFYLIYFILQDKLLNGFTTVWSQHERVYAPFRTEVIQHRHIIVGVHVLDVVRIRRILVLAPLIRRQHVPIKQWILRFGFIA